MLFPICSSSFLYFFWALLMPAITTSHITVTSLLIINHPPHTLLHFSQWHLIPPNILFHLMFSSPSPPLTPTNNVNSRRAGFWLICSVLYPPNCLVQYLGHGRNSINIWWVDKWRVRPTLQVSWDLMNLSIYLSIHISIYVLEQYLAHSEPSVKVRCCCYCQILLLRLSWSRGLFGWSVVNI